MVEFIGTYQINSVIDAYAIRRAAYLFGKSGIVIASPTDKAEIKRTEPYFRAAGWRKSLDFVNPRTDNPIQVWIAKTLKSGETNE